MNTITKYITSLFVFLLVTSSSLTAQETYKATFPQNGKAPAILVSFDNLIAGYLDSLITVEVVSNVDFTITPKSDWLKVVQFKDNFLYLKTTQNEADVERVGSIEVAEVGGTTKKTVQITQSKNNAASFIKGDIKIKVSSGSASQEQPGEGIEKSFDGDYNTIYHSPWGDGTKMPVTLTYNFTNVPKIDYLVYNPRRSGGNGNFNDIEVYTKKEGDADFTLFGTYKLNGSSTPFRIEFPDGGLINPTSVRFVVKSGSAGYASCAEMDFFAFNASNSSVFDLFEDKICTRLKPGVTDEQIDNLINPFTKRLARALKSGTYNTEFRVNEFEAFPTIGETSSWMKTSGYNQFENPTGIFFESGDEIVIFVDNPGTESVALLIRNQNPEESGSSTYFLKNGMNKIKASNRGQGYLNYFTTNWASAPNVKVHFAFATVTGYYDLEKYKTADGYDLATANSEWERILKGAISPMFDVVSKRHHTCYPTAGFRRHHPRDGANFALAHDSIVYRSHEIMGLIKYKNEPKNRQYTRSVASGMFADGYGAGIPNWTSFGYINVANLDWWGVGHELGHVNQVRPALKWVSTTEVTNNIYSAYVQHKVGNSPWVQSLGGKVFYRLEHESHGGDDIRNGAGGRFNAYLNYGIKDGNRWLMQEGPDYFGQELFDDPKRRNYDHFVKLAPLWNLTLYFMEAGVYPDFWADIFEAARKLDDREMSNGELQINFMKSAMDASKLNLTHFFEKSGMLRDYNVYLEDYSPGQMTITKAQVDELKAYATKYPNPESPVIYYISAMNWETYRDKADLEVIYNANSTTRARLTTYLAADKRVNVLNATVKNAVAFETFDADGKLVRITMKGFRNPSNTSTQVLYPAGSARIDAIGWDGTRKTIYDVPN